MRHVEKIRARSAFTLIELLIFIAIFALIISAFIAILVSIINIQTNQVGVNEVETQGQFVTQQISYYVQGARLADMTLDGAGTSLVLRESNPALDPTTISFSSGTLYLQQGISSAPTALTSNKVTISNVSFTRHYNLNSSSSVMGTDSVTYSFTLTGGTGADTASETFQGSAPVFTPVPEIALVQKTKAENNSASVSSISAPYPTANEKGDLLLALVTSQSAVASGISDTAGNSWTTVFGGFSSGVGWQTLFAAIATSTGMNTTTVTFGAGAGYGEVFLYEYRGVSTTTAAFPLIGATPEYSAAPSSSMINTAAGLQLLFAWDFGKSLAQVPSPGPGFIFETSSTVNNTTQTFAADSIQYLSNPINTSWSFSTTVSSTPWFVAFP